MCRTVMIEEKEYKIVTEGNGFFDKVSAYANAPECWKRTPRATTYYDNEKDKWYFAVPNR